MSDTVLAGRWTVYYEAENRQKRIKWTGGAATADTVKSLYLALMDLFDELPQMDDGTPMKADTPTEYAVGIIDPGDDDPWFIDPESVEHLTGGAIKTLSWKRVEGSNTGIIRVLTENCFIVEADIGYDVISSNGDSGTLLDVRTLPSGEKELWIRPDTDDPTDSFADSTGILQCNLHGADQIDAAATGEMLWANIYGLGTIVTDTHLYIYQGAQLGDTAPDAILTGYKTDFDWWDDGFFDVLVMVADQAADLTTRSEFIDEGYITVLARQYGKTYTYYIVDLFAGGRNPIPLETGNDLNNTTGWRTVTGAGDSAGDWNVGDEIEGQNTGARGKIAAIEGANPNIVLRYYLIGDVRIDFQAGETIDDLDDTGTCTAGAPADYGPALLAGLSIVHSADNTHDIDEDGSNEYYSIVIDVNNERLYDAYEWAKYETRRGEMGVANHDGIEGEQYIGSDYRIVYTSLNGAIAEGSVVQQPEVGAATAKGTVVAHHTGAKVLILRNCRGTFNNVDNIGIDAGNFVDPTTCSTITPIKACPYGTFAGGVWFAAPGVVFDNIDALDGNNYQLTDDQGNVVEAPTKVTVAMTNSRIKDRLAIFRLTAVGGQINKAEYQIDSEHDIGDVTIKVDPVITADTPGKTTGGILFVVDASAGEEHRYRYETWSGDVFNLFTKALDLTEGGTDSDTIHAAGGFADCKVGDIIYNFDSTAYTYIKSITNDDEVEIYPSIPGQGAGEQFRVGVVVADYVAVTDKVYVPLIHVHETAGTDVAPGSESISVVYLADIPVRIRARHANDTQYNIKPFETDGKVEATGMSVAVIRTPETITS